MNCYSNCKLSVALPHGPWVGLQCVIVVFPDHTHLPLDMTRPNAMDNEQNGGKQLKHAGG